MDLDRLLPEPPAGYTRGDAPVSSSLLESFHHKLLNGVINRRRELFVANDRARPVVIEVGSLDFSTQDLAAQFWNRRPSVLKSVKRVEPTAENNFVDNHLALKWSRGEVRFTEIARLVSGSIISAVAADDSAGAHEQSLEEILDRISESVPSRPARSLISSTGRRVLRAAVLAAILVPAIVVARQVAGISGSILGYGLILVGLAIVLVPYLRARTSLRRSLQQGDTDGAIRRILASRGIHLL